MSNSDTQNKGCLGCLGNFFAGLIIIFLISGIAKLFVKRESFDSPKIGGKNIVNFHIKKGPPIHLYNDDIAHKFCTQRGYKSAHSIESRTLTESDFSILENSVFYSTKDYSWVSSNPNTLKDDEFDISYISFIQCSSDEVSWWDQLLSQYFKELLKELYKEESSYTSDSENDPTPSPPAPTSSPPPTSSTPPASSPAVPTPLSTPRPEDPGTKVTATLNDVLKKRRRELGINYNFFVDLVDEAFYMKHPNLQSQKISGGPEQKDLKQDWEKIAFALMNQLEKLPSENRQKLGSYSQKDYANWSGQLSEEGRKRLGLITDTRFFELFPEMSGTALKPKTFGQIWYAIAEEKLADVANSQDQEAYPSIE